MSTLLITLKGPQQSWGARSRFSTRGTELAPTKSGVIGMIAAALGIERSESLERFSQIRFGVRVDRPGRVEQDFQTESTVEGKSLPLSHRYYLADAVFLVGIESSMHELENYRAALSHPYFPLFLGRRAFPPAGPLHTEFSESPLLPALKNASWRAEDGKISPSRLEIIVDADPSDLARDTMRDVPISFDPRRREYGWRDVSHHSTLPSETTTHDPLLLLSDEEV